jgi:DNA adenine methylase
MSLPDLVKRASAVISVMTLDPMFTTPWILLHRDLSRWGVANIYYATVEGRLNKIFLRDWMRSINLVANSEYSKKKFEEAGFKVLGVVHHGIDPEAIEEAKKRVSFGDRYIRDKIGDRSGKIVALTVSNSHPRKGLAWLNKIASIVHQKDPSIKFLVITEDRGLDYFIDNPAVVAVPDFGRLDRSLILSIIASADILVFPSLSEGFGLPVLEAMALGVPVVHAELPPLMEFSVGFTVPVKDVSEFDKSEVGLSGIIYEQHIYDVHEFADVIIQVADLVKTKSSALANYRRKASAVAKKHDIYLLYPKLISFVKPDLLVAEPGSVDEVASEVLGYIESVHGKSPSPKVFRFPGGDYFIKDHLMNLISRAPATKFVEVFGGSGYLSMTVPRDKFKLIVYNDIDELLVNLFLVIKDRYEELQKRLALLPFSRSIFKRFIEDLRSGRIHSLDPVEKAVETFYILQASMWGIGLSGKAGFAVAREKSMVAEYNRKISSLPEIAKRLRDVVIENKDFREVIRLYDTPETLFYCDPPFLDVGEKERDTYYRYTFTEADMRDLLNILSSIKGKFILKLPEDNFKYDFIKSWVESNRYSIYVIEHSWSMKKTVGSGRPRFTTYLVYNYLID